MIYDHYSIVPWDIKRWPNFHPGEKYMHCSCCGEFFYDEESFDMLQNSRNILGKPIKINCAHRCVDHNVKLLKIGAAPNSEHLRIAFDISTIGQERGQIYDALRASGFTTFGFYKNFIHTDKRQNRRWFGKGAYLLWYDHVKSNIVTDSRIVSIRSLS